MASLERKLKKLQTAEIDLELSDDGDKSDKASGELQKGKRPS